MLSRYSSAFRPVTLSTLSSRFVASNQFKRLNAAFSSRPSYGSGSNNPTVYASYNIYKGKTALNVKPLLPALQGKRIVRDGALLLEFAPSGATPREYDWTKKQFFALTVAELGELVALDKAKGIEFFHDPNLGGAEQGQVTKRLKITPTPDGKGFYFGLQINDKATGGGGSLSLPVSFGEFEVLQTVARYFIPRFLGFDLLTNPISAPQQNNNPAYSNPPQLNSNPPYGNPPY